MEALAVRTGEESAVDRLVRMSGFGVGEDDGFGDTLLHVAAGWDDVAAVRELLGRGVDVNVRNAQGETPLHSAAYCMAEGPMIRALLEEGGADIRLVDERGWTAADVHARKEEWARDPAIAALLCGKGGN